MHNLFASSEIVKIWNQNFLEIPVEKPFGKTPDRVNNTYTANDAAVGNLDGEG